MTSATPSRYLHVANGTSTTGTIEAAGLPGTCSIWADPLFEGPVPAVNDAELLDIRVRFLAGGRNPMAWAGSDPSLERANDLREWRAAIERHESYDELVLWFEHDLFDQLNLIQLLAWIHDRLPRTKPVSLVCIGAFPGRPDFKGLGELTPDELAPLFDSRETVTGPQYAIARRAWQAFRDSTPEALDGLRQNDTSPLPHLAPAITRFLQEYPWTIDGLSRTERRLLQLADGDPVALWKAFPRMSDGEQAYYVADSTLAEMAEALSRTSPPLLALDVSGSEQRGALRGSMMLTDAGRSVLTGRLDRVTACGLDRWLGGVHLKGRRVAWRWNDERESIVRM